MEQKTRKLLKCDIMVFLNLFTTKLLQ